MNYETVKSFGMEREEVDEYKRLQRDYQGKYINLRRTLTALNFGQFAIQSIGLGISLIFAAFAASYGHLSAGDFVLVQSYVRQLFQPLFVCHLHIKVDFCFVGAISTVPINSNSGLCTSVFCFCLN